VLTLAFDLIVSIRPFFRLAHETLVLCVCVERNQRGICLDDRSTNDNVFCVEGKDTEQCRLSLSASS
jgi:hypothetical protein